MSGIEVVSLAFGVLPVLIEVVKSYSAISKRVRTLRHYSKEMKSISEQLRVHNGIFLNEVRLLLRLVEAEEEVESMLEDAADHRWISKHINEKLRVVLRDSFDVCRGIIEETKDTIEMMKEETSRFDDLLAEKKKGESFKLTLKRLGGAVKITFDKSRHDRCLTTLRDRNGDLSALRSQIGAFQRHDARGSSTHLQHSDLPSGISSIQSASQKLHDALCDAWCCDDPAHRCHYAKLCVDAQVEAEVRLDLAISCHEPSLTGKIGLLSKPPIWLHVQSMSTSKDAEEHQAKIVPSKICGLAPPSPLELLTSCAVNSLKKKASSDLQRQQPSRKRGKRVHFVETSPQLEAVQVVPTQTPPILPTDLNLCQTKNICRYLQKHYHLSVQSASTGCIGYLETPRLYRHLFYFRGRDDGAAVGPSRPLHNDVYSLFDIMRRDVDDTLTVEDQLRLAHKTAIALLQFNDTPWLSDQWRLRDLSYFGSKDSLDTVALKTLHLSSQISAPRVATALNSTMDGIESTTPTVSDQSLYGIHNTTLFFLGVALIEIAHWKPIEEKMTDRDLNNEVVAARRLAAGRAPLGPHYQKIAEKCLQCNFGFGTKLSNKRLQTAVYNDVVCELESMIEKLTI